MSRVCRFARRERGISLIETMIALFVLAVGLVGTIALVCASISSNARSKRDSTGTALAEMVIGQLSAIPVGGGVASVTITDCAGNANTLKLSGAPTGAGANLTSSGNLDFTQSFTSVPSGYAMKFTVCGVSSGTRSVYDVRWNVQSLPSGRAEFVVVGAQFTDPNSSAGNGWLSAPAVNVRTVVGNDGS